MCESWKMETCFFVMQLTGFVCEIKGQMTLSRGSSSRRRRGSRRSKRRRSRGQEEEEKWEQQEE